jgi:hypothetical protein
MVGPNTLYTGEETLGYLECLAALDGLMSSLLAHITAGMPNASLEVYFVSNNARYMAISPRRLGPRNISSEFDISEHCKARLVIDRNDRGDGRLRLPDGVT